MPAEDGRCGDSCRGCYTIQLHNVRCKYENQNVQADIGMSRTAFYNRVKFIVGKSPTNYILSYKMGIAKTMLASRQYNVSEIATLLGYCDAKYFGKKFKEFYGISPMQYVRDVMG